MPKRTRRSTAAFRLTTSTVILKRMTVDIEALTTLSERQHGVFSRSQAERCAMTEGQWHSWRNRHQLVELHPGVASLPGTPLTFRSRVLGAVLASPKGTVASCRSAAALLGCWSEHLGPVPVEVTTPRQGARNLTGVVVHRPLDQREIVPLRLHGIPSTNGLRTLTDLGQVVSDDVLRNVLHAALTRHVVRLEELSNEALRRRALRRVGPSALLRVIGANLSPQGFVASELERMVVAFIASAGLPEPERNYEIGVGGRCFTVDLAWPLVRFAVELDGRAFHADRFDEDRKRDVTLKVHGWDVHRYTWKHATVDRAWMLGAIATTLRARGMPLTPASAARASKSTKNRSQLARASLMVGNATA